MVVAGQSEVGLAQLARLGKVTVVAVARAAQTLTAQIARVTVPAVRQVSS